MKVKIFRFLSALVKIYQIHHAVFETMSQFFFSVMKNNSSDTSVSLKITPLYILGQTLYTLHKWDTEQWCKIWINLALGFQKWHEELGELSLEHSKVWKKWNIDRLFLSKTSNVSARKFHKNYVSQHWRVVQKLKKNWLVALKMI